MSHENPTVSLVHGAAPAVSRELSEASHAVSVSQPDTVAEVVLEAIEGSRAAHAA